MELSKLSRVYFVGIGGIGMSAIARYFNQHGIYVSGYDRTPTSLTRLLEEEGIKVHYQEDLSQIDTNAELVIYTPAIPEAHAELVWYRANGYLVVKRSDALQWITDSSFAVTVAGTHGKTTISSMIAVTLRESGVGSNAFLGGVSVNYNSNYWPADNNIAVIEADEYDRSFLKLHPDIAILTALDADHLDIYKTESALVEAFIDYTRNIKREGTLIFKYGLKHSSDFFAGNRITYSLQHTAADVYASDIVIHDGGYQFDLVSKLGNIKQLQLNVGGIHNVENAVAAIAALQVLKVTPDQIRDSIAAFRGVKRRFEYVLRNDKVTYIDDYAHHPEELLALIQSAKMLFPDRRCVIAFQPHLFSRTRDFAAEFAHSLDMADEVLLLDIYPARELPMPGVTSSMIADYMKNPAHKLLGKEALLDYVAHHHFDLFITAGAGDIEQLVMPIKQLFQHK